MAVTIYDIAQQSGLSLATVSRVINHSPHVSQKSKQKVEAAIRELNYIPNAYARGLSKSQTNIAGVIVPEITNPFFGEVIRGITEVGTQNNLNFLFFNTNEDADLEERALHILQEYRIQGLIITPVTGMNRYDQEYVKRFEEFDIPIVLIDRDLKNCTYPGVFFDDRTAIFKITSLLIENGHRNIKALIGNPDHQVSKNRVSGYKDAFDAYHLTFDPENLIAGEFSIASSYQATKDLILNHNLPTAFLGMTNMLSLGCLKALFEYDLSIPEDVAFVGYDKLELHEIFNLNLTLAEKDAQEMGRRAARMLLEKLDGDNTTNKTLLMPELFSRGSERFPVRQPNLRTFSND